MDPLTMSALISGAGSLVGGFLSNKSSAKSAAAQMEFQERMSSTAHQREVKDLKKAGLNPILSAFGSGSSTPSGSSYIAQDYITPALNSASTVARTSADTKKTSAETANIAGPQAKLLQTQSYLNQEQGAKANADSQLAYSNQLLNEQLTKKAAADTIVSAAQAAKLKTDNDLSANQIQKVMAETKSINLSQPTRELKNSAADIALPAVRAVKQLIKGDSSAKHLFDGYKGLLPPPSK